jgi:hypothetical protein
VSRGVYVRGHSRGARCMVPHCGRASMTDYLPSWPALLRGSTSLLNLPWGSNGPWSDGMGRDKTSFIRPKLASRQVSALSELCEHLWEHFICCVPCMQPETTETLGQRFSCCAKPFILDSCAQL